LVYHKYLYLLLFNTYYMNYNTKTRMKKLVLTKIMIDFYLNHLNFPKCAFQIQSPTEA